MQIKSFADCSRMWATRKRKLANNTYLVQHVEQDWAKCYFAVKLHATEIVKYYEDGRVTLDSGGWRTPTTKERMSDYSPISVRQERSVWYVRACDLEGEVIYADGITLHPDRRITGAGEDPKAAQKLRRKVLNYARDFMAAFGRGEVEAPGSGDCWFCALKVSDSDDKSQIGKPWGDKQTDHLLSHIEEKYYVPSLLASVIAEPSPVSPAAHDYVVGRWAGQPEKVQGWRRVAEPQLVAALANYMLHRFGQPPTRAIYGC